jgi:hypothetical protein
MKRLIVLFLAAGLFTMAGRALAGDTGTYRISNYEVALTPRSDGTVAVQYYQKWLVTGGHIPWITVGTSNGNFTITGSGGSVSRAESAGQGGWSGARLDLDRDYQSGETFEVSFSIVQKGLFYAEEQNYKFDFTPGWYDRAVTDTLRMSVKFFAKLETVTADPQPSFVSGEEMVWNKYGLGAGEHFSIHVSFPVGLFPAGIAASNLKKASGGGGSGIIGAIVFIIIIVIIIIMIVRFSKRGYSGGRMFYGGIPGGRPGGGGSGGGRSAGGGGGFGGASMSCACACVSCACACACAGGGGAGCSRKQEHTCPICEKKREE